MVALVLDGLVGFPAGLSPTSFRLSPSSFHFFQAVCGRSRLACLLLPFICLPLLFNCLPVLFTCLPGWVLVVGFPAGLSPTSLHLSPNSFHLSPRPLPFSCLPLLFIVSQAGCLWSGSRPACLPLPFICLPLLFICLPGWLVFHFLSFVSQARCLWSGSQPGCLPLPFICLPLLFICLPGWALALLVPCSISIHLSFRSVTGGVRPFPLGMQHFYSFVSRVCHWCCRPFLLFLFICLPCLSENSSAGTKPERQKERNHRGDK